MQLSGQERRSSRIEIETPLPLALAMTKNHEGAKRSATMQVTGRSEHEMVEAVLGGHRSPAMGIYRVVMYLTFF